MTPFFESWQAFINMGGYGFYVWLSYGISAVTLLMFIFVSVSARKHILRQALRYQQRQAMLAQKNKEQQHES